MCECEDDLRDDFGEGNVQCLCGYVVKFPSSLGNGCESICSLRSTWFSY